MSFLELRRKGQKSITETVASFAVLPKEVLGISGSAAARVLAIIQEKANPNLYFRVAIKGGGCSGLSIHYDFCEALRPHDQVFEQDGAKVCIDKKSLSVLGGATLHFRKNLGAGEFALVNNPAAKQCSCGQSFSL